MRTISSLLFAASLAAGIGIAHAEIPRPEYPRPQFERSTWINLNGDAWTYTFDFGESGRDPGRELFKSTGFDAKINVPFCPESSLSGVKHTDFIPAMWYHRKLAVPADWNGKRVILHFGAVDYESEIYINGKTVGFHFGGTVSFSIDITPYVKAGETYDLVVRVKDDTRNGHQPGGKQCNQYKSHGCSYTRTTGIWQTVWMEAIAMQGLKECHIVPDLDNARFVVTPSFYADAMPANEFRVSVKTPEGKTVGNIATRVGSGVPVSVPLSEVKPWSPADPYLYDITFEVADAQGAVIDSVKSYAGLRKIHVAGNRVYLNNKPIFLRLVLDQGFYPDGIWTAPTDAALKRDIELSMAAGFNGARLHQKVFEERFHYWADKLGYLTWGETSSWGCDPNQPIDGRNFITEWGEIVRRDRNHPSIIAWTPFNETWGLSNPLQHQRLENDAYDLAKSLDPTRPVNTASGDIHAKTDLWTIHNYSRADKLGVIDVPENTVWSRDAKYDRVPSRCYTGQPYIIDEFGGLMWIGPDRRKNADNTWGYGGAIKTDTEFFKILEDEVNVILKIPRICGYCYTQLTDVEQEQNGVYYYDRVQKFDPARFKAIFGRDPDRK
ncbi:MAG: beta-glucuronidase [Kiritimatiellae bacterium]|nr:beta-glucuronidase [Kiritimatiellia bacterium]